MSTRRSSPRKKGLQPEFSELEEPKRRRRTVTKKKPAGPAPLPRDEIQEATPSEMDDVSSKMKTKPSTKKRSRSSSPRKKLKEKSYKRINPNLGKKGSIKQLILLSIKGASKEDDIQVSTTAIRRAGVTGYTMIQVLLADMCESAHIAKRSRFMREDVIHAIKYIAPEIDPEQISARMVKCTLKEATERVKDLGKHRAGVYAKVGVEGEYRNTYPSDVLDMAINDIGITVEEGCLSLQRESFKKLAKRVIYRMGLMPNTGAEKWQFQPEALDLLQATYELTLMEVIYFASRRYRGKTYKDGYHGKRRLKEASIKRAGEYLMKKRIEKDVKRKKDSIVGFSSKSKQTSK